MNSLTKGLTRDPLLTAAKGLLYVIIGIIGLAGIAVAIATLGIGTFGYGEATAELAKAGAPGSAFWVLVAVLALATLLLFLILRFCLELRRIVISVDQGDPFQPVNALRLTRMAWLSLGAWAVSLPLGGMAAWLGNVTEGVKADVDFAASTDGLLLALVLFILARVFRQGAAMREDLEGTV